ncbi:hypothetical protein ACTXT7_003616 [Hymenolepis weldensis]
MATTLTTTIITAKPLIIPLTNATTSLPTTVTSTVASTMSFSADKTYCFNSQAYSFNIDYNELAYYRHLYICFNNLYHAMHLVTVGTTNKSVTEDDDGADSHWVVHVKPQCIRFLQLGHKHPQSFQQLDLKLQWMAIKFLRTKRRI